MNRSAARRSAAIGAAILAASWTAVAFLQERNPEAPFFDYRTEAPGTVRNITVADLPRPYAAPVNWDYRPVLPATWPQVPQGFTIEAYVTGLSEPRYLKRAPNGDVFMTESYTGRIKILRDVGERSPQVETFATGLTRPFGIAFYPPGPGAQLRVRRQRRFDRALSVRQR